MRLILSFCLFVSSTSLADYSLEKKYGARIAAKSVRQALEDGYDVPVKSLNFEYAVVKNENTLNFLSDLNVESSKVWLEMVACSNNDLELTRKNYYLDIWSCAKAEELRLNIKALKVNVENYLISFPFPKNWVEDMDGGNWIHTGYNTHSFFFKPHPLFMQIVWEQIAFYYLAEQPDFMEKTANFFNSLFRGDDAKYKIKNSARANLKKVLKIHEGIVKQLRCEDMGLWPALNRAFASYASMHADPVLIEDFQMMVHWPNSGLDDICGKPVWAEESIYAYTYHDEQGKRRENFYSETGLEVIKKFAKLFRQ